MGGNSELMFNAIMKGGRLVGMWEYNPGTASIAALTFGKPDPAAKKAVAATEAMIRAELEDVRGFSLDSPKSRQPRIDRLRGQ